MNTTTAPRTVHLIALCLAAGVSTQAQAQPWELQSPYPSMWDLTGAAHVGNTGRVVVCGDDRQVLHSDDGGTTWFQANGIPNNPNALDEGFRDMSFANATHGWVIGNSPHYRTTDGGQSWSEFTAPHLGSFYYVDFVTEDTGFLASNFGMWRTDTGGDNWTEIWPVSQRVYQIDWISPTIGFHSGTNANGDNGMFRTTDGGQSWTQVLSGFYENPTWLGGNTILASKVGSIFRSDDLGQSWTNVFTTGTDFGAYIETLGRVDADSAVIMTNDLRLYVSDDTGFTWTQTQEPTGDWGYDWTFSFDDLGRGVLSGANGMIYMTDDGGHAWRQANRGMGFLSANDIEMIDTGVGVSVSQSGSLLRTTNFGQQWDSRQLTDASGIPAQYLNSVQAITDTTWVIAGHEGHFFWSEDAGVTWSRRGQPDLYFHDLHIVDFENELSGIVFGRANNSAYGILFRTDDGGFTWERMTVAYETDVFFDGEMIDNQVGFGMGRTDIYRTDDRWESYDIIEIPQFGESFRSFAWANDQVGYLGGDYGKVVKSTDGGYNWTELTTPIQRGSYIAEITVLGDEHVWVATGPVGKVYESTDGGDTWTILDTGYRSQYEAQLTALDVLPDGRIWTTGFLGITLAGQGSATNRLDFVQSALVRGFNASFIVTDAEPGERTYFVYSLAGVGAGPCPPALGGLCLDLLNPVTLLGSAIADATGEARLSMRVPANAPLVNVHTQAAIARGVDGADSVKSTTITDSIQP